MIDIMTELKGLRLHGMASAWADLMVQDASSAQGVAWLLAPPEN
jgi:hypothetical protein